MSQERIRRHYTKTEKAREEAQAESMPSPMSDEDKEKLKTEIDDLLDAVDEVLEESGLSSEVEARDFVASYQQKGGE